MLPYSLLFQPLANRVQRPWLWPQLVDPPVATPNAPPWTPYAFRPGGYWQPQKALFWPTPGDLAVPGPLVPQYVFRRGGFWQPQKRWGTQPPADQSTPNAPPLRQYAFRPGGLWQTFKVLFATVPPIFTPYVPPPIGSPLGEVTGSAKYSPLGAPSGEVTGSTLPSPIGTPTQN